MTEGHRIDRLYRAMTTPQLVQVPPLKFLCLDGHGDPNTSPAYAAAVQALYSVSYAAKFAVKKAGGPDFKVSALEGLVGGGPEHVPDRRQVGVGLDHDDPPAGRRHR
jgi:hypothetical protein